MRNQHFRYFWPLGAISVVGPFSVDMYLPTFPSIAAEFHTTSAAVQLTMVSYAVALAVGQMLYGPAADMFGRRPPLFVGLALYCVASLACALSTDIHMLIVMRFFQGLGACCGMVIARAVVRDVFRGPDAVKMLSLILLMISVSPILAPLAGSSVALFLSWRWIFGILTALALVSAMAALWLLPETMPPEQREARRIGLFLTAYARLATQPRFLGAAAIVGFASGIMFAYLSGSSLLFIQTYGVAPTVFSLIFAVNAVGMIGTAQFNAMLVRRFGPARVVIAGCGIAACFLVPLGILTYLTLPPLALLLGLMFASFAAIGLINGPATMLAMETQQQGLGSASAVVGVWQYLMAGIASWAVSALAGPREAGMFVVMAGCALSALSLALIVAPVRRPRVGSSAPSRP